MSFGLTNLLVSRQLSSAAVSRCRLALAATIHNEYHKAFDSGSAWQGPTQGRIMVDIALAQVASPKLFRPSILALFTLLSSNGYNSFNSKIFEPPTQLCLDDSKNLAAKLIHGFTYTRQKSELYSGTKKGTEDLLTGKR